MSHVSRLYVSNDFSMVIQGTAQLVAWFQTDMTTNQQDRACMRDTLHDTTICITGCSVWSRWMKIFVVEFIVQGNDQPNTWRGCSDLMWLYYRADSRFAASQWGPALLRSAVSHWLVAKLESAMCYAWLRPCDVIHVKAYTQRLTFSNDVWDIFYTIKSRTFSIEISLSLLKVQLTMIHTFCWFWHSTRSAFSGHCWLKLILRKLILNPTGIITSIMTRGLKYLYISKLKQCSVEVCQWKFNFIPHSTVHVITYSLYH